MTLPHSAIQEFKELYLKEFGIELTDNEAVLKGNELLHLYTTLIDHEPDNINNKQCQK